MSEEQVTENSEATESTEEVAPQTTPEEQYVNTRPEHIPEKFWTNDGVDVDEMAKSYNELEKYVGGKKDDYKDEIMEELANEHMQDVPENYEDNILSVVRCPFDRTWSMYNFYGFTRKDFLNVYTFEEFVSKLTF